MILDPYDKYSERRFMSLLCVYNKLSKIKHPDKPEFHANHFGKSIA